MQSDAPLMQTDTPLMQTDTSLHHSSGGPYLQEFFIIVAVSLIDAASFALFLVVGLVGLYQLILYKMQADVFFIVPKDEELLNFRCAVSAIPPAAYTLRLNCQTGGWAIIAITQFTLKKSAFRCRVCDQEGRIPK